MMENIQDYMPNSHDWNKERLETLKQMFPDLFGNDLYFSAHYFFKYQKAEFLLTRAYLDKVVTPNIQITHSFDFITKKWIKTQGVINSGQGHKETLKDLNNIENKTLKTFERPFTWFIAGVYL